MISSTARFETPNGAKYIVQLCKHFAHKVDVSYDETSGRAALPPGPATMQADAQGLTVTVTAEADDGMTRARFIIEDHLKRFAFREDFERLTWSQPAPVA
ncbi:DUF2218 domain-containing protein [Arenibacterium halophilum]|uniref:DUF2218 domain-containing protein n=1 Tax=Arenibacterium halophilum TaxID=2583821 RepID=A0ABY2X8G4_9RHOB|nr:DUF2218 domain-containing protein [Arenibacterium halophilum]